jgi:hypothetical protein
VDARDFVVPAESDVILRRQPKDLRRPGRGPCTIETGSFHFSVKDSSVVTLGHPRESAAEGPAL